MSLCRACGGGDPPLFGGTHVCPPTWLVWRDEDGYLVTSPLPDDTLVTVCASCSMASCWHGEHMCDRAVTADTKKLTLGELRKLDLEHPENWDIDPVTGVSRALTERVNGPRGAKGPAAEVSPPPIAVPPTTFGRPLIDAEMVALAALVQVDVAMVDAANAERASRGFAPAYDHVHSPAAERLEAELKRRGVL